MFYDLPDPVQFAKDIYSILDESGIWTCEQSYVLSMLNTNSIDTICHEHLEYYSIHNVKKIADLSNFKIIDIKFNDCNGGSFRIYLAKKDSEYSEYEELGTLLENENEKISKEKYIKFVENCEFEIEKLKKFINTINKNGKKVYIYGASTKGNCLLQYANISEKDVPFAVERNLNKVGKMTSTGIPIISEETMRNSPPDYLLVLPWHFRNEIIERESEFLNNGGQFIFPFPNFEIVSTKKKVLITGCDGMIANYFIKNNDYSYYGIGNKKEKYNSKVLKFYHLKSELESYLLIVKPDIIIHLAGISNSKCALENPVETINTNGVMAGKLCDIIHRNKLNTKLFNASSSEIYKGHINYFIEEDSTDFKHSHPYSIAKIMSHSIIDFYRNTYNLPFSNGILFTTESPLKSKQFLLNKVSDHIKNRISEPLNVGNLDSYRNIIHASDVASAINVIISQNYGDNYVICGNELNKIYRKIQILLNIL
jgi:GDP-D-mannose dehydratase